MKLSSDEFKTFGYIWDNMSVGEIILEWDLARLYSIKKPINILRKLRELGLIERGEGCYNLSPSLRKLRKKVGSFSTLRYYIDRLI